MCWESGKAAAGSGGCHGVGIIGFADHQRRSEAEIGVFTGSKKTGKCGVGRLAENDEAEVVVRIRGDEIPQRVASKLDGSAAGCQRGREGPKRGQSRRIQTPGQCVAGIGGVRKIEGGFIERFVGMSIRQTENLKGEWSSAIARMVRECKPKAGAINCGKRGIDTEPQIADAITASREISPVPFDKECGGCTEVRVQPTLDVSVVNRSD